LLSTDTTGGQSVSRLLEDADDIQKRVYFTRPFEWQYMESLSAQLDPAMDATTALISDEGVGTGRGIRTAESDMHALGILYTSNFVVYGGKDARGRERSGPVEVYRKRSTVYSNQVNKTLGTSLTEEQIADIMTESVTGPAIRNIGLLYDYDENGELVPVEWNPRHLDIPMSQFGVTGMQGQGKNLRADPTSLMDADHRTKLETGLAVLTSITTNRNGQFGNNAGMNAQVHLLENLHNALSNDQIRARMLGSGNDEQKLRNYFSLLNHHLGNTPSLRNTVSGTRWYVQDTATRSLTDQAEAVVPILDTIPIVNFPEYSFDGGKTKVAVGYDGSGVNYALPNLGHIQGGDHKEYELNVGSEENRVAIAYWYSPTLDPRMSQYAEVAGTNTFFRDHIRPNFKDDDTYDAFLDAIFYASRDNFNPRRWGGLTKQSLDIINNVGGNTGGHYVYNMNHVMADQRPMTQGYVLVQLAHYLETTEGLPDDHALKILTNSNFMAETNWSNFVTKGVESDSFNMVQVSLQPLQNGELPILTFGPNIGGNGLRIHDGLFTRAGVNGKLMAKRDATGHAGTEAKNFREILDDPVNNWFGPIWGEGSWLQTDATPTHRWAQDYYRIYQDGNNGMSLRQEHIDWINDPNRRKLINRGNRP